MSVNNAIPANRLSLGIQSVIFHNDKAAIFHAFRNLVRSLELAIKEGKVGYSQLVYGDCSSFPVLDEDDIRHLRDIGKRLVSVDYWFFHGNLGSAAGHNRLAESLDLDALIVLNPDVILSPDTIGELIAPLLTNFRIGMVEARQIPIEHPKDYNPVTGETSWASTACVAIPNRIMKMLAGFDSNTFFLYCDDVDFSWRVRLAGYKVIFQPSAVIFHDKRLSKDGGWISSNAERYYSAEAALLLAHKWSRPDLVRQLLADFEASGLEVYAKAIAHYQELQTQGKLPTPIDGDNRVGEFIHGNYGNMRFQL